MRSDRRTWTMADGSARTVPAYSLACLASAILGSTTQNALARVGAGVGARACRRVGVRVRACVHVRVGVPHALVVLPDTHRILTSDHRLW